MLYKPEIGVNGVDIVDIGEDMRLVWSRSLLYLVLAGAALLLTACINSSSRPIVFVSESDGDREILTIDPETAVLTSLTDNEAADFAPTWSNDHRKIVYLSDESGAVEINQVDRKGEDSTRLTFDQAPEETPLWSPSGNRLAWVSQQDGDTELYVMDLAEGEPNRITFNGVRDTLSDWSPDGEWLVFFSPSGDTEPGLWLRNPSGVNLIRLTQGRDTDAVWSPDGERIAFVRIKEDNHDIYLATKEKEGTWRGKIKGARADGD